MKPYQKHNRSVRCFSLVEILVALAIIIIVASAAAVSVVPMTRGRELSNGANAVHNALRHARTRAVTSRRDTSVFFEYGGVDGVMEVAHTLLCPVCREEGIAGGSDQCPACGVSDLIPDRLHDAIELPDGVIFGDRPDRIVFTSTGALRGGSGRVEVVLQGPDGNTKKVEVYGASGIARTVD